MSENIPYIIECLRSPEARQKSEQFYDQLVELLGNGEFEGYDLEGIDIQDLQGVSLRLKNANLSKANLSGAYILSADLHCANLSHAQLRNVEFAKADLTGANFSFADLYRVTFGKVILEGANFRGAKLVATRFLEGRLHKAYTLRLATMPNGELYDGQFKLQGDLSEAIELGVDPNDELAMRAFYVGE